MVALGTGRVDELLADACLSTGLARCAEAASEVERITVADPLAMRAAVLRFAEVHAASFAALAQRGRLTQVSP